MPITVESIEKRLIQAESLFGPKVGGFNQVNCRSARKICEMARALQDTGVTTDEIGESGFKALIALADKSEDIRLRLEADGFFMGSYAIQSARMINPDTPIPEGFTEAEIDFTIEAAFQKWVDANITTGDTP